MIFNFNFRHGISLTKYCLQYGPSCCTRKRTYQAFPQHLRKLHSQKLERGRRLLKLLGRYEQSWKEKGNHRINLERSPSLSLSYLFIHFFFYCKADRVPKSGNWNLHRKSHSLLWRIPTQVPSFELPERQDPSLHPQRSRFLVLWIRKWWIRLYSLHLMLNISKCYSRHLITANKLLVLLNLMVQNTRASNWLITKKTSKNGMLVTWECKNAYYIT